MKLSSPMLLNLEQKDFESSFKGIRSLMRSGCLSLEFIMLLLCSMEIIHFGYFPCSSKSFLGGRSLKIVKKAQRIFRLILKRRFAYLRNIMETVFQFLSHSCFVSIPR